VSRFPRARGPRVVGPVLRVALPVLACAGLAVLFIWTRTQALDAAYDLAEQKKQHDRLSSMRSQLQLEVETLRSPGALDGWARVNLGMAPPAPGAVLAAGPRSNAGRAGVDGVGHPPSPAGPLSGRAAGAPAAPVGAARGAADSGERLASRGPSRAARAE